MTVAIVATPAEIALRLQAFKYTKIAGMAALIFDYCIKLEDEIYFTWGKKFGLVRILFVVARYMPFAYVSVDLIYSLGHNSPQHCFFFNQFCSWANVVGTAAAEALLLVRTYTLLGRNRPLFVVLLTLAMGSLAATGVVCFRALSLFNYQDPPLGASGCYETKRVEIYAVDYALLSFYETVMLSLSVKQLGHLRLGQGSSPFITNLYWDGIRYVVCILAMSAANIVVIYTLPSEYAGSMRTFQAVLHSVLSSRLLFNLRAIVQHQRETIDAFPQTSIEFLNDIPLYSKSI